MKKIVFALAVLALSVCAYGQVSSPYWNQGQQSNMPSADIRAVPEARAGAVRSNWTFNQRLTDLNNAVHLMTTQMEQKPEYRSALDEDKKTYEYMQKARADALVGLKDNIAYVAAQELADKVTAQIEDEKFTKKPDLTKIQAMAMVRLQYITDNRKLEADTLKRDDNYQKACQKMYDAAHKLEEIRQSNAILVATDQNLVNLRQQVAMARIDKLTAGAYYESTIDARNIAIDYARFYRGMDIYHGYGYGGYGYHHY